MSDPGDYPDDADGQALRRLARTADMSRPMEIDFSVVAPDEASARAIGHLAEQYGYTFTIAHETEAQWGCTCTKVMLATYDSVMRAQAALDAVSAPFGGRTDGWGTFGNK